jgi:hypothetical protein
VFFKSLKKDKQKGSTTTRFELARAEPIGFQNQLLNHSDTLSEYTQALQKYITSTKEVEAGIALSIPNKQKVQQNKSGSSILPGDPPSAYAQKKKTVEDGGFDPPACRLRTDRSTK